MTDFTLPPAPHADVGAAPAAHPGSVIEARALTKRYGVHEVVRGIDLVVPRGLCFGLLGPNGAGKTTTIRMILGQTPVDGGTLRVFGQDMPAARREVRARLGVVPQMDSLDPDFTVIENLYVYARYYGLRRRQVADRIAELLDLVELGDRAATPLRELSGGMKRRLSIARALVSDPELLVLDEPTTGLDPQVRHLIWRRLRQLRQAGKTLFITTHYMEEAERLCDQLVIMDHGIIIDQGRPADLVRRHVEPEVVEIHGDKQVLADVLAGLPCRAERVVDTVYCYTSEARRLTARLADFPELTFLYRPANLEDVFVKLIGRELRE